MIDANSFQPEMMPKFQDAHMSKSNFFQHGLMQEMKPKQTQADILNQQAQLMSSLKQLSAFNLLMRNNYSGAVESSQSDPI